MSRALIEQAYKVMQVSKYFRDTLLINLLKPSGNFTYDQV
jgi:hypothetical protein